MGGWGEGEPPQEAAITHLSPNPAPCPQHKIDGVLLDGCAFCAATAGLYGSGGGDGGSFSILQCQCSGGNPFPLACSPAAGACPLDGNETAGWWPWRLGVAGGAFARRGGCRCPHRPWDAALVDDDGDVSRRVRGGWEGGPR